MNVELKRKYWSGTIFSCQLCKNPLEGVMYDALVPRGARWGNLCQECFTTHGCSVGLGRGQKYLLDAEGRWYKVEG